MNPNEPTPGPVNPESAALTPPQTPVPATTPPSNDIPDGVESAQNVIGVTDPITTPAPEPTPTPTPPTDPAANINPVVPSPTPTPTPAPKTSPFSKFGKKNIITASIVLGALIILGGGGYTAYAVYESPMNVVNHALLNLSNSAVQPSSFTGNLSIRTAASGDSIASDIRIDADFTVGYNDTAGAAKLDGSVTADGKAYKASLDSRYDLSTGDAYLEVTDAKDISNLLANLLVSSVSGSSIVIDPSSIVTAIQPEIENKWIKIPSSDDATQKCIADTWKKVRTDKDYTSGVSADWQKNTPIKVDKELGLKNGNYGFTIINNEAKSDAFVKDLKSTKIYKDLTACDSTIFIATPTDSSETKETVTLYISQWTHEIQKVEATENSTKDGDFSISIEPSKAKVTTDIPSTTTDFETVYTNLTNKAITALEEAYIQQYTAQ